MTWTHYIHLCTVWTPHKRVTLSKLLAHNVLSWYVVISVLVSPRSSRYWASDYPITSVCTLTVPPRLIQVTYSSLRSTRKTKRTSMLSTCCTKNWACNTTSRSFWCSTSGARAISLCNLLHYASCSSASLPTRNYPMVRLYFVQPTLHLRAWKTCAHPMQWTVWLM